MVISTSKAWHLAFTCAWQIRAERSRNPDLQTQRAGCRMHQADSSLNTNKLLLADLSENKFTDSVCRGARTSRNWRNGLYEENVLRETNETLHRMSLGATHPPQRLNTGCQAPPWPQVGMIKRSLQPNAFASKNYLWMIPLYTACEFSSLPHLGISNLTIKSPSFLQDLPETLY